MTRRERLEAKLERRREWAQGREAKAAALNATADPFRGDVAFNTQPGHIPLRARIIRNQERAWEHSQIAAHHESKADGLERALDHSVFSDDADAIQQLEARITKREADQERMKAANVAIRKSKKGGVEAQVSALVALGFAELTARKLLLPDFAGRVGFPGYSLTNNSAQIRTDKARIEEIKRRQNQTAAAEAAPGGVLISGTGDYVNVTFAEKPEREVINALKAAGFRWGSGSWCGYRDKLPIEVIGVKVVPEGEEVIA